MGQPHARARHAACGRGEGVGTVSSDPYPLLQVLVVAFTADGHPSLIHLRNFFGRPLFREALANSLLAGLLGVLFGSLLASRWRTSAFV